MTTILKRRMFSGTAKVFDGTLEAMIRGIAQDNARGKIQNAQLIDLTDSTTGAAQATLQNLVIPSAVFDATSAGGAERAGFNTAMGKYENACAVFADIINKVGGRIGVTPITWAVGTIATAGTLPAQDKSVSSASSTSAIDYVGGKASMRVAKANMRTLVAGYNDVMNALGFATFSEAVFTERYAGTKVLADVPTAAASASGASSIAKTVMDTFLDALADNLASLAAAWNRHFIQGEISDLTDSTGGTASISTLAAQAIPSPAAGAATTSAPKAGFDTQLQVIENNLSDLTTRMNLLRGFQGLSQYTDSTGVSADTTLAALSVTLTAVDGSTGTDAVDEVTARARMATIANALSSLCVGINELAVKAGVLPLTDAVGGTASTTIANIAATGTGVGDTEEVTLLDADVDAWLVINRNNIATLAAKLNEITGSGMALQRPLQVVAG